MNYIAMGEEMRPGINPYMDFRGQDLTGQDFSNHYLAKSDFTGANLSGCNFRNAYLARSNFCNADMLNADITDADVTGAFAYGAKNLNTLKGKARGLLTMGLGKPKITRPLESVKGRDVILVGGGKVQLPEIANPLVVWTNNHWLKHPTLLCHGIFHSCEDNSPVGDFIGRVPHELLFVCANFGHMRNNNTQYAEWEKIAHASQKIELFYYYMERFPHSNPYGEEMEWINDFQKQYDFTPLTGMLALEYLIRAGAKSVAITGMDFYYDDRERGFSAFRGPHDITKQLLYLLDVIRSKRCEIILDTRLREVWRFDVVKERLKGVAGFRI